MRSKSLSEVLGSPSRKNRPPREVEAIVEGVQANVGRKRGFGVNKGKEGCRYVPREGAREVTSSAHMPSL